MLNLIKKDVLLQKHLVVVYIGLIGLYLYIDMPLAITIVLTSALFVLHSHYYDEKDKSNLLLNSLPYSRKEIVSSKYLEAIIVIVPVSIIGYAAYFIFNRADFEFSFTTLLGSLIGTMLFTACYLPFFYRFQQQHFLMIASVLVGLMVALMPAIIRTVNKYFSTQIETIRNWDELQMYSILGIVSIVLYVLSWRLTIRIYNKRAF